jgi:hypothetical protein
MLHLWDIHMATNATTATAAILATPNLDASLQALYKNQKDLGANLALYYGPKAGKKFASLLTQHEKLAVDIVNAKIADQQTDELTQEWYANATSIAEFLVAINPMLKYEVLKKLFYGHLQCITEAVTALLNSDYEAAQKATDRGFADIKQWALYIANGTKYYLTEQREGH